MPIDTLLIEPKAPLNATLRMPGSKSLTNRALIVAALAEGVSTLRGALLAEDSEVMVRALRLLGIPVATNGATFTVHGQGGCIPAHEAALDLRLSGTSIRFLTALVALGRGHYRLDGNERMRERPIQDLLNALSPLGVRAETDFETGCPPLVVEAHGLSGGKTAIRGDASSQYLSALLMVSPYADGPVALHVLGELQSKPFVDMTLSLMRDFGVEVARDGYRRFDVSPARYRARDYPIEGDAMAAGYFWAAAAIVGGSVTVEGVGSHSHQGDRRFLEVLGEMGCGIRWEPHSSTLIAPGGRLRGGRFDLNDMPDQAQTLAVVGLFADAPVRIDNVPNMRIKETDRLAAMSRELRKLGARVEEESDALVVHPLREPPTGAVSLDTYGDHRMAMALSLAGLRLRGVSIRDPACVDKTFPEFFDRLRAL